MSKDRLAHSRTRRMRRTWPRSDERRPRTRQRPRALRDHQPRRSITVRKLFAGLVTLLELAVVAQFFLAASAAFDTAPKEESFGAHRSLAYGITLLAIVLTILAAVMRLPGRLIGMTGLIAALVVV